MATMTRSDVIFDPYDEQTARDPQELFRMIRDEVPLYHNEEQGFYALSRFDDVERGHMNANVLTSGRGVTYEILKNNEPFSARHRSHGRSSVPPNSPQSAVPDVHPQADRRPRRPNSPVLRRAVGPHVGENGFHFATDLGAVLPMRVISMLVGIPEKDQESIRDHFAHGRESTTEEVLSGDLFKDYIEWRAEHPSDDIMTILLNVEFRDESGAVRQLTREELLTYVSIVAAAGNDTTKHLITWSGKLLGDHADERRMLVRDPALIPNAVEEVSADGAPVAAQ